MGKDEFQNYQKIFDRVNDGVKKIYRYTHVFKG